ncbi:Uncharacterised protein [Burkholderia pseudomallei]|uniref:hypothetical protein n=1 Tax=Burkholderia pseudomallei TaxID=28450 RepID=UPI000F08EBCD|nr:hypothetical protein [Burkholderia pseudomallei]CAJ7237253.1 Uncharacterised protein [Burkholderia pseudomallei]VBC15467.1 Uncharacterised protein [Burkholderia pseudomallei]VBS98771.1 Uncharacterised protein [Burkholderia pseudomallei]
MYLLESIPTEWLILIVIAVLYLTDSVVLLDAREALIYPPGSGWAVAFGSRTFTLRGRPTYLLSVWMPHRPVFRLSLREICLDEPLALAAGRAPMVAKNWDELRRAYGALLLVPWAVAAGLFVFLPLGLFTAYGHRALWSALVWIYGPALAGVILAWRDRHTFGLTGTDWAGLAFDVLACPPHALNLVRKLSLHSSRSRLPDTDLLRVAAALLSEDAKDAFRRGLEVMVEDLMDVENNEAELERLGALREALKQEVSRGC